jgi:hypothetical protein
MTSFQSRLFRKLKSLPGKLRPASLNFCHAVHGFERPAEGVPQQRCLVTNLADPDRVVPPTR